MRFKQGQDIVLQIQRQMPDKTPVDLTGFEISAKLKGKHSTAEMEIRPLDLTAGLYRVVVPAAVTRSLTPGHYNWDIHYTAPGGQVTVWPRTNSFLLEIVESPSNG